MSYPEIDADLEALRGLSAGSRVRSCVDCGNFEPTRCRSCLGSGYDPVWIAHALLGRNDDWALRLDTELNKTHESDGACGDPDCCGDAYCFACSEVFPCTPVAVLRSTDADWQRYVDTTVHIGVTDGPCPACRLEGRL